MTEEKLTKPIWNFRKEKIENLKLYERNPRLLTEKGMADLKKSIDKFGLCEPIVVNADLTIIGGHARYHTLKSEGAEVADIMFPDRQLTTEEIQELNIRLNLNIAGEFNWEILANDFDIPILTDWGFNEKSFMGENIDFDNIKSTEDREKQFKEMTVTCPDCQKNFTIKV